MDSIKTYFIPFSSLYFYLIFTLISFFILLERVQRQYYVGMAFLATYKWYLNKNFKLLIQYTYKVI